MKKRILHRLLSLGLGVLLTISLFPIPIYGAVQSDIGPTFAGNTSSWSGHLWVTNFSDGTNTQASSLLTFTLDDDYYGMIYFDGYGSGGEHIANFATVYIAGGYGEYRYSYYQNGLINITSVTIQIVNVVKPDTTVDLTQIIQLLTAIESDTTAIDNVLDSTLIQIRNVLNQLVISNGYLQTLTKIRQWNIPFESLTWNYYLFDNGFNYDVKIPFDINYFQYPIFSHSPDDVLFEFYTNSSNRKEYTVVMLTNRNVYNLSQLNTYFGVTDGEFSDFKMINSFRSSGNVYNLIKFKIINFTVSTSTVVQFKFIGTNTTNYLIPIYFVSNGSYEYVTSDFADLFGLLGYTESSEALDDTNTQFQTDANSLISIEDSFNSSLNSNLDNINPTFNMGSSFLASANWVSTQFNRIVNNTPFASLITFGLTLGLGLLIIGKIRK